jgi:putative spermidine/putrescine transport system permease protein
MELLHMRHHPALPAPAVDDLRAALRRTLRRRQLGALALIAPLALYLLVTFLLPVATLLWRAVDNPEVADTLPRTVQALEGWHGIGLPPDAAWLALAHDLDQAAAGPGAHALATRLNREVPGARSVILRTTRAMPLAPPSLASPAAARHALLAVDPQWGNATYWEAIARNAGPVTPFYLLSALDLRQANGGLIEPMADSESAYVAIFLRTFNISLAVTLSCLLLAYPLAYWLAGLPPRQANLAMIVILIPFWTSILVRVAAWMVLLQAEGLVNSLLRSMGLIEQPLEMLFNRGGTCVAMVHILLPFMVLPLYSAMKAVPPTLMRAAISLGSHPFAAFWRVYVPQTLAGVQAGCLLVFILALGYYITPSLLGGAGEQMVSYYVAYFTNVTINWGMACALGGLLLCVTLLLYGLYQRSSGALKGS